MRRPHGAMTRPMARKSVRSACSWSSRRDDVGRHADERAQRRGRPDAVLAAVPGAAEHQRDLLEVVDEELLRILVHVAAAARCKGVGGEQLLQLLRERRLRDPAAADAEQLDLVVERRILAIVERPDDVVRRGQVLVAVQLPAREAHQMRRVQPRVLRVDRHEHLDDVILGQPVEDDRRHAEVLAGEAVDVRVQREQAVLAVDRAEDPLALGHLQDADARVVTRRLKRELLVAAR